MLSLLMFVGDSLLWLGPATPDQGMSGHSFILRKFLCYFSDSPYATLRRAKPGRKNKKVSRAWSFHATKDEKSFLKQYGLMSDEESSAKVGL